MCLLQLLITDLLKEFNPDIKGFSVKTGKATSPNAHFNQAVSGAVAEYANNYNYCRCIPISYIYGCHVHLSARYKYYVFYLAFCTQAMVVDWFGG